MYISTVNNISCSLNIIGIILRNLIYCLLFASIEVQTTVVGGPILKDVESSLQIHVTVETSWHSKRPIPHQPLTSEMFFSPREPFLELAIYQIQKLLCCNRASPAFSNNIINNKYCISACTCTCTIHRHQKLMFTYYVNNHQKLMFTYYVYNHSRLM